MQTNTDRKVSSAESSKEEQTIISFQLFFFEDAKEELEKIGNIFASYNPFPSSPSFIIIIVIIIDILYY